MGIKANAIRAGENSALKRLCVRLRLIDDSNELALIRQAHKWGVARYSMSRVRSFCCWIEIWNSDSTIVACF